MDFLMAVLIVIHVLVWQIILLDIYMALKKVLFIIISLLEVIIMQQNLV